MNITRAAIFLLFLVASSTAYPGLAQSAGFQSAMVPDSADKPIEIGIWYPSTASVPDQPNTPFGQALSLNGTVSSENLPLIIISHGKGGWLGSHADTALALAEAGYVVVAPTHTGDNIDDESYSGSRLMIDRPRHIGRVLDYMLGSWSGRNLIDAKRIGIFGFSAGAYTALVVIGGVPNIEAIARHCAADPGEYACSLGLTGGGATSAAPPASTWSHDLRVKAAVVAAPALGFAFEGAALAGARVPVQLWAASDDRNVPFDSNTAIVRRALPVAPEFHEVDGAGHFDFLPPCSPRLQTAAPKVWALICTDASGFDRAAFHQQFNKAVIRFFDKALAAD